MSLLHVLFRKIAQVLRDLEWIIGHEFFLPKFIMEV